LEDLGLLIPASSQVSLHEQFEFSEIANADPLKAQVAAGNIIINDGTSNLSISDALYYIDYWGKYEYNSEQAFIEGYKFNSQYLIANDTYKILDISDLDITPKNAQLVGTTELELLSSGLYKVGYRVDFYYEGNANTIEYYVIIEKNGAEIPKSEISGWTRYSGTRLCLTNGINLTNLVVNDLIRIKAKVNTRYDDVTIEYTSILLHRIYD
jgi:hypothetical protein